MRLDRDEAFMAIAYVLAGRGTCVRRKVGCVLIDENQHIIGTGYNGAPRGAPHCYEFGCAGAGYGSGLGLDHCEAIHAEQNALLQCRDPQGIVTAYTTTFCCVTCFKLLANTSCKRIVFAETYFGHQTAVQAINAKLPKPLELEQFDGSATKLLHSGSNLATIIHSVIAEFT